MNSQTQNTGLLPNTVETTELVLARSIGVFSLLLTALALPDLLQDTGGPPRPAYLAFVIMVPALIVAGMVLAGRDKPRRFFAGTVAWLILLGFLLWHLGLIGNSLSPDARPWSWGIAGAGVGLAAVAKNIRMASLYGLSFTVLVLVVPGLPAGSSRDWSGSWQDALLTAAMTAVIIAPIWALRQAVLESEQAAVTAVEKFSDAARSEAITVERMRLDALTHDIVLSTLIVASQGMTPEVVAASRKAARAALVQLDAVRDDAGASQDGQLTVAEWLGRLGDAVSLHGITVERPEPGSPAPETVPLLVARAMVQAATEAVRNSLEHAGGAETAVKVSFPAAPEPTAPGPTAPGPTSPGPTAPGPTAARLAVVEISDNGPGFDLESIALERMGIKVSIIERMQDVRGLATVDSSPGAGTLVRLQWGPGRQNRHEPLPADRKGGGHGAAPQ